MGQCNWNVMKKKKHMCITNKLTADMGGPQLSADFSLILYVSYQSTFNIYYDKIVLFNGVLDSIILFIEAAGILYSFGIIYVELLKEFNETKAYTSWVVSLMTALGSLAGNLKKQTHSVINRVRSTSIHWSNLLVI